MKKGLIVLGCLFLLSGCGVKDKLEQKIENKIENKKEEAKLTLKDLLTLGKAQKCEWKFNDGETSMEGDILIKGNKFRQTVAIKYSSGEVKETKMITVSDGDYFYSWDPIKKSDGIKIKLDEETKAENDKTGVDLEKEYNYNCKDWNISEADLTPPSDIKFVDIMAEMQKFGDQLQNMLKDIPSITPEE